MGGIARILDRRPPPPTRWDGWLETGTYMGDGAHALAEYTGVPGITVDVTAHRNPPTPHPRIQYHWGDSAIVLPDLLATLRGHLLVWLDAHFPDVYQTTGTARPLQQELDALWQWQQTAGNIPTIYADDARILGMPAQNGPMPTCHGTPEALDLQHWTRTHRITMVSDDEGYLILTPRETP